MNVNNRTNQNSSDPISEKVKEKFIQTMKSNSNPVSNSSTKKANKNTKSENIDKFKKRIEDLRKETAAANTQNFAKKTDFNTDFKNQTDQSSSQNLSNDGSKNTDNSNTGTAAKDKQIELLQIQIKELETKYQELNEKYLKSLADLQNTQKQHELDLVSAKKSAKKGVATTLSTFVNTFNLAFSYQPKTEDEKIQKFIQTLQDSFNKSIKDLEVHSIFFLTPKVGDDFDPNFMEILNPDSIQDQENVKVKQVISSAVKVDTQIIQPATIMV
jgi:molecular chaperone GrpE